MYSSQQLLHNSTAISCIVDETFCIVKTVVSILQVRQTISMTSLQLRTNEKSTVPPSSIHCYTLLNSENIKTFTIKAGLVSSFPLLPAHYGRLLRWRRASPDVNQTTTFADLVLSLHGPAYSRDEIQPIYRPLVTDTVELLPVRRGHSNAKPAVRRQSSSGATVPRKSVDNVKTDGGPVDKPQITIGG